MSDVPLHSPFGGNSGEPVAEVDPDDLRAFWQKTCELQMKHGRQVSLSSQSMKDINGKPGANTDAIWYRASMIWVIQKFAPTRFSDWIKGEVISDAVVQTMATIPMEWIGRTERNGLPFDFEVFLTRLKEQDRR